jgi:hypothetical protein
MTENAMIDASPELLDSERNLPPGKATPSFLLFEGRSREALMRLDRRVRQRHGSNPPAAPWCRRGTA